MWAISGSKILKIDLFTKQFKYNIKPEIGIVLGSGLGDFVHNIKEPQTIDYKDIKGFPVSTVQGHEGKFIFGKLGKKNIICAQGRFHLYEGYDYNITTLPIDVFNALGCTTSIITNAAGCMNKDWKLGKFMLINRCIDFTFSKQSNYKIHFKKHDLLDDEINKIMDNLKLVYQIYEGTYSWVLGPTYETPSEIKKFKSIGGDVIGMSTMPEILKAYQYGMRVIGLSCLSNYAAGISKKPLTHQEVLDVVNKSKNIFSNILVDIIKLI